MGKITYYRDNREELGKLSTLLCIVIMVIITCLFSSLGHRLISIGLFGFVIAEISMFLLVGSMKHQLNKLHFMVYNPGAIIVIGCLIELFLV